MISRLAFLLAAAWFIPVCVDAACLFGGRLAGQSPAYQYAVSFIHGVTAADTGLNRISSVSRTLTPTKDHLKARVDFTDALKQYELAARDFECVASSIESQQNFSARASNSYAQEQTKLARLTATTARERSALIKMLDSAFGERIAKKRDRPAMEAAAALLKEWLTTSDHIPAPE